MVLLLSMVETPNAKTAENANASHCTTCKAVAGSSLSSFVYSSVKRYYNVLNIWVVDTAAVRAKAFDIQSMKIVVRL
jgi:hypothetical protein